MILNSRLNFQFWIIGLAAALSLAFGALFLIGKTFGGPVHKGLSCVVIALFFAPMQGLLLRRLNISVGAWIVVTITALGLIGSIFGVGTTEEMARRGLSVEWVGPLLGAAVGFVQWFVLRRHFAGAVWWIPVNFVAWIAGFFSTFMMVIVFGYNLAGHLIGGALFGLVVGVSTGYALIFLESRTEKITGEYE